MHNRELERSRNSAVPACYFLLLPGRQARCAPACACGELDGDHGGDLPGRLHGPTVDACCRFCPADWWNRGPFWRRS